MYKSSHSRPFVLVTSFKDVQNRVSRWGLRREEKGLEHSVAVETSRLGLVYAVDRQAICRDSRDGRDCNALLRIIRQLYAPICDTVLIYFGADTQLTRSFRLVLMLSLLPTHAWSSQSAIQVFSVRDAAQHYKSPLSPIICMRAAYFLQATWQHDTRQGAVSPLPESERNSLSYCTGFQTSQA